MIVARIVFRIFFSLVKQLSDARIALVDGGRRTRKQERRLCGPSRSSMAVKEVVVTPVDITDMPLSMAMKPSSYLAAPAASCCGRTGSQNRQAQRRDHSQDCF